MAPNMPAIFSIFSWISSLTCFIYLRPAWTRIMTFKKGFLFFIVLPFLHFIELSTSSSFQVDLKIKRRRKNKQNRKQLIPMSFNFAFPCSFMCYFAVVTTFSFGLQKNSHKNPNTQAQMPCLQWKQTLISDTLNDH